MSTDLQADRQVLIEKGDRLYILKLQGFLFFGTANNLLTQLKTRIKDAAAPKLRFVVLDFRLVNGFDSSALNSFTKMKQIANAQDFMLIFSHISGKLERRFKRGEFFKEDEEFIKVYPDMDHAVEWCENQILMSEKEKILADRKPAPHLRM